MKKTAPAAGSAFLGALKAFSAWAAAFQLTSVEYEVLTALHNTERRGMFQFELSDAIGKQSPNSVSPATLSKVLSRLERKGLIQRSAGKDGRTKLVEATDQMRKHMARLDQLCVEAAAVIPKESLLKLAAAAAVMHR